MDEVMDRVPQLFMDAVPHPYHVNIQENSFNPTIPFESFLDEFGVEEYKSAFFLLMDFVGLNNYFVLTKQDKPHLKDTFIQICHKSFKDERILIELLGTLKMYKKLKLFGTCYHVHESQRNKFHQIDRIWKVLYSLCEELTDEDVRRLKEKVPSKSKDQIQLAEDWFCWALQTNIFSRTDLSNLENVFSNYPSCLNIIKSFKGTIPCPFATLNDFDLYEVKVPTSSSDCGIALILNYDTFDNSSGLKERKNSQKDVDSLKELWENFGFKTDVYQNLNSSQTLQKLKIYASINHSIYDAFVCCILSHGLSNAVYTSDGKLIEIPDLIAPMVNECLSLNKKPKLFFIQACQGTNILQDVGKPIFRLENAETLPVKSYKPSAPPRLSDVLIVNSSIDGYVSFRSDQGSWFIQTLYKLLKQYGDKFSIEEVMIKVNEDVGKFSANFGPYGPSNAVQIVPRSSTLSKKLILKKRMQ